VRRGDELLQNLLSSLYQHGIQPSLNGNTAKHYTEQRRVSAVEREPAVQEDGLFEIS
jgi:hypothetical protein